jgi:copper chaperone CopZ
MQLKPTWLVLAAIISFAGKPEAATSPETQSLGAERSSPRMPTGEQVVVQIMGSVCEYERSEVESVLRTFNGVEQVEFLNRRGTVLVSYRRGSIEPQELANSVERALAMGWNCKAEIDRGRRRLAD